MILVDKALAKRQAEARPIRVGMVGAGFMGRGIALQIATAVPGMELVAIANRNVEGARHAFEQAGQGESIDEVATCSGLEATVMGGRRAITNDAMLLCQSSGVEALIEVTGTIEFAAGVVLEAIRHGKHVIAMNAELDGTLGPLLKRYADEASVIFTNADGDQPGVIMNLYRFVKGIGVRPVLCGNIKGLHDPYRNPTTQEGFARRWKQKPHMVTSFADGTKISFEQAIVANATAMRVAKRGMHGPIVDPGTPIRETAKLYPMQDLMQGRGVVDYVVGAEPSPGVFVLGTLEDPTQKHYLELYKLGPGPLYCFYTPYHLCHFEVPHTVARAVLFADATIACQGPPQVDVVATAKCDLAAGTVLDGIGHYMTYGLAENAKTTISEGLLPMGIAEGCRLRKDLPKDTVLTYQDVELPPDRLCDRLRAEQTRMFFPEHLNIAGPGNGGTIASGER